jgi:DNA-directed RNA polymerase specialized sigma24 family protein/CheY-like chemotaxis protein
VPGLSEQIAPLLPYLRRHARALTGRQDVGDAYVAATLEAIVAAPGEFPELPVRAGLYRMFHVIWRSASLAAEVPASEQCVVAGEKVAAKRLSQLTPLDRQALLLTVMEGFSNAEAAAVLGTEPDDVARMVADAVREIDRQTRTSVLIIEDEAIIAMDLEQIVGSLGHAVLDVAATRDAAVHIARARRPGLVVADIQLADGSSGVDAVREILESFEVPVIFVTAYPERLLMGSRPEPIFLITKPYEPEQVKAAISQALFFEQAARLVPAESRRSA